jgi:hypothetical protein
MFDLTGCGNPSRDVATLLCPNHFGGASFDRETCPASMAAINNRKNASAI